MSLGDKALVESLIKNGANVNVADASNMTPLQYAVNPGSYMHKFWSEKKYRNFTRFLGGEEILELLLRNGADMEAKYMGFTALHLALAGKLKIKNGTNWNRSLN